MASRYRARHSARREQGRLRAVAAGTAATLAFGGLVVALGSPTASAEEICTRKCYSAVVAPQSSPASTSVGFGLTLTNLVDAGAQRLGSADLTPPAGFSITSVDAPARGSAALVGGVIQFRNIDLAEGAVATYTFTGTTPAATGTYTWLVAAKQANDFSGVGNSLALDKPLSDLTTSVTSPPPPPPPPPCVPVPGEFDCADSEIDYSKDNFLSTGDVPDALVEKVVVKAFLAATSNVGTQPYRISALSTPGACPLNGDLVGCTFGGRFTKVPTQYAGVQVRFTFLCDFSVCKSTSSVVSMTHFNEETGVNTQIPSCSLAPSSNCWKMGAPQPGYHTIIVENNPVGDPRIAGIMVGPEQGPEIGAA